MKIQQIQYVERSWKIHMHAEDFDRMQCQLVLVFGEPSLITKTAVSNHLDRSYPEAHIILRPTPAGIENTDACNSVFVTAIQFDNTTVHCAETSVYQHNSSYDAGHYLVQQLQQSDLSGAFIVSDCTYVNGGELLAGFNARNAHKAPVMSRLANENSRFAKDFVQLNQLCEEGLITAIGFYGQPIPLDCLSKLYRRTMTVSAFTEF